jgi:DNA invertase Pin-like site-specific DNA recombinase
MPKKAIPLSPSQKKFVDENYSKMSRVNISNKLKFQSAFKIYEYCNKMGYSSNKKLTEDQKQFIRDNYLSMKESEIMRELGITRMFLQRFKREESLFTYRKNRKEKKIYEVKEMFFDVDSMESWVA